MMFWRCRPIKLPPMDSARRSIDLHIAAFGATLVIGATGTAPLWTSMVFVRERRPFGSWRLAGMGFWTSRNYTLPCSMPELQHLGRLLLLMALFLARPSKCNDLCVLVRGVRFRLPLSEDSVPGIHARTIGTMGLGALPAAILLSRYLVRRVQASPNSLRELRRCRRRRCYLRAAFFCGFHSAEGRANRCSLWFCNASFDFGETFLLYAGPYSGMRSLPPHVSCANAPWHGPLSGGLFTVGNVPEPGQRLHFLPWGFLPSLAIPFRIFPALPRRKSEACADPTSQLVNAQF